MTAPSQLARAARTYAERFGWPVFPLVPGRKVPFSGPHAEHGPHICASGHQHQNGSTNATTDLAVIEAWWREHPEANIGMATGRASASVLDVDIKAHEGKRGDIVLDALTDQHGSLDETPWMMTWSGGRQYFFAYSPRARQGAGCYGKDLDGRNDGGYTVLPPSIVRKGDRVGEYAWAVDRKPTQLELAPFPLWLADEADRIKPPVTEGAKNPPGWADTLMLAGVEHGRRDTEANRLIARCHATGRSEAECLAVLFLFGSRCVPPFDPFKDPHIMAKIRRRYAQPQLGVAIERIGGPGTLKGRAIAV